MSIYKSDMATTQWKSCHLKDFCKKQTAKNTDKKYRSVFTNSAIHGVIKQEEYFDKEVANGENIGSYYIVPPKDFIYNPRISESAPYGPIRANETGETGVASPLYFVFEISEPTRVDYDFLKYYFTSSNWHRYIYSIGNNGARSDRMNVADADFMNMPINLPPVEEQRRIAEVLGCCDRGIALKKELIEEKKRQKKALMQKLLNPASGFRLPGFSGKWKTYELRDLYSFKKSLCAPRAQLGVHGVAYLHYGDIHKSSRYYIDVSNEFDKLPKLNVSTNCSEYMLLDGDVVFVDASEDYGGASKYIVVINPEQNPFLAGLHTIVARPKKRLLSKCFQQFCFQNWNVRHQFFHYTSGMKVFGMNTKNLGKIKLSLPVIEEQKAIADILSAADREIDLLEQELSQQEQKKKTLMQLLLTGTVRTI